MVAKLYVLMKDLIYLCKYKNVVYIFIEKIFEEIDYCKNHRKTLSYRTHHENDILEKLINVIYVINCILYNEKDWSKRSLSYRSWI